MNKPNLTLIDPQADAEQHMIAELKRYTRLGIRYDAEDRLIELGYEREKVQMAVRNRYEMNYKLLAWRHPNFVLVQGPEAIAMLERFIRT
jgi:hypothetical protein